LQAKKPIPTAISSAPKENALGLSSSQKFLSLERSEVSTGDGGGASGEAGVASAGGGGASVAHRDGSRDRARTPNRGAAAPAACPKKLGSARGGEGGGGGGEDEQLPRVAKRAAAERGAVQRTAAEREAVERVLAKREAVCPGAAAKPVLVERAAERRRPALAPMRLRSPAGPTPVAAIVAEEFCGAAVGFLSLRVGSRRLGGFCTCFSAFGGVVSRL
jgi:hypothetical protein